MISKQFPELDRLPTANARREALAFAIRDVAMRGRYWLAVAGIVTVSVYVHFSLRRFGVPPDWRESVRWSAVVVTILAVWSSVLLFKRTIRRTIWRLLADRGIPCCTSCGYDVRLLPTEGPNGATICPECGKRVTLPTHPPITHDE